MFIAERNLSVYKNGFRLLVIAKLVLSTNWVLNNWSGYSSFEPCFDILIIWYYVYFYEIRFNADFNVRIFIQKTFSLHEMIKIYIMLDCLFQK